MIGPTGCGKTEISRRLAKLAEAPFVKVEATKFTEVGYVGRDVEQIIRDLVEDAIRLERERRREEVRRGRARRRGPGAERAGRPAGEATTAKLPPAHREGAMNDVEVEIEVEDNSAMRDRDSRHGAASRHDEHCRDDGQGVRRQNQAAQLKVPDAWDMLVDEEADKRLDQDEVARTRSQRSRTTASCSSTRSTRSASARGAAAPSQPRGRPARPPAADRGHYRRHQVRADEDRPRAVHRLGRVPPRQAERHAARAAGPPADPRRAAGLTEEDFVRILSETKASLVEQYAR